MDRKPKPLTDEQVQQRLQDLRAWTDRNHRIATKARSRAPRRNDSKWREDCLNAYGHRCVVCGDANVEVDHIIPRSQGGASVVENGLVLCGAWSATVDGGHHGMKTAGTLQIRYSWLTEAQLKFLGAQKWVGWDRYGETFGGGFKHFARRHTEEYPRHP